MLCSRSITDVFTLMHELISLPLDKGTGLNQASLTFCGNPAWLRSRIISVCIYRCVITLGLCFKYEVHGHYFMFAVEILTNYYIVKLKSYR